MSSSLSSWVINLTEDNDEEGLVVGENEVPIRIHVEHDDMVVPETPGATLIKIEEDGRATPQLIGEVE